MRRVYDLVSRAAGAEVTVLLRGETGTGKGLFARAVHANSARAEGALRDHRLHHAPRVPRRERALRPRARGVHRRRPPHARPRGARRRGHAVSRRDRGAQRRGAGQAAAPAAGAQLRARGRPRGAPRQRAGGRGDAPGPRGPRGPRAVSRRPAVPPAGGGDRPASAARARRRRGCCPSRSTSSRSSRGATGAPPARSLAPPARSSPRTAGRATCASWSTRWSARWCSATATRCAPTTSTCARGSPPREGDGLRLPYGLTLDEVQRRYAAAAVTRADGNQSEAARSLGVSRNTLRRKVLGEG
jgi:hypothetical protein